MPVRPALVSCDLVAKSYGGPPLFEGLTFVLHEGDHVGVVGPNGAGKSTLLKILGGVETPDAGTCTRRKGLRIGYVPQTPVFAPGTTAAQIVAEAIANDARLDEHEREERVGRALWQARFTDPQVPTDRLSGGWKARLAIARELAREPDLLLLDEPTNHLDIESILWLETLLERAPGAFVAVSHDRYFLERVARRMLEINRLHDAGLFQVRGTYADFLEARDAALSREAAYRDTLAGLVRREVAWLRRGAKARTRKSKAHIDSAGRSIEELEAARARSVVTTVGIAFTSSGRKSKRLWAGTGLRIAFGATTILDGLDLVLTPGMRLGVIGPNGSGKTTLLRTIVGEIAAAGGTIERAEALRVVYFAQDRGTLDPRVSLKRALAPEGDLVIHRDQPVHVAAWARRFLFRPEQLETPVSRLSGGERARIILARMMLRPADLLVLDEPTNDLDIPALDVLEEALLEFPGALVLVSHDRYLLDRVSTGIVALDGKGGARHYADYDQWEAQRRSQDSPEKDSDRQDPLETKAPRVSTPREPRPGPRRLSYLEQREWDGLEAAVLEAESRLADARRRAEDSAIATDAAALQEALSILGPLQTEDERLYARWTELDEKQR
jgi:ATP-binding cassette subfamily F protein uup